MSEIMLKKLLPEDCTENLLLTFRHCQIIRKQWIRGDSGWILAEKEAVRRWSEEKRKWIPVYLKSQMERGGTVTGAYDNGVLAGFAAVDGEMSGGCANLTMLFVDDAYRRRGIGRLLFRASCEAAKKSGADRLYISAIPAEETIAFYQALGCCDAEPAEMFIDSEYDRPMAAELNE